MTAGDDPRFDPQRLVDLGHRVIDLAGPGEEMEVGLSFGVDVEVRAYGGEVESLSSASSDGAFVRVITDGREGTAVVGSLEWDVLVDAVAEARDNARFTGVDPTAVLARPDGVAVPHLDVFDAEVLTLTMERRIEIALELEAAVMAADPRICGLDGGADYADSIGASALVTTAGICAASRETNASVAVFALADDGDDVQVGYGVEVSRGPGGLDIARCASDSAIRATRMLGANKPRSMRLPVIFDPMVSAQFFGLIADMLSAETVLKGRSPFANRLGDSIAASGFSLREDPTDPAAFGASTVDDEGLASRATLLIDRGTLRSFLHNTSTAAQMGTVSTASAVRSGGGRPVVGARAVSVVPGTQSAEEVWASVGDAVLVQEVIGMHSGVNPVSGDFSTGVEGVMLRNGVPAEPIREAIVAGSLQRMMSEVLAVGADVTQLPMEASGVTLALDEMTLSGS